MRTYGYPPDMQLLATETVLKQAEMIANELNCNWFSTLTDKTKGEKDMGDKGSKDKGKKEEQKKSEHTLKEKRKLKQDKKNKPSTIPA